MPRRDDYGRILPTHRWRGQPPLRRWWRALRWWLLAALLVGVMWQIDRLWQTGPRGTPIAVSAAFHRCGLGRGANCVIDGDTFIMGQRHFRITGIDAAEIGTKARCPAEAAQAEVAAAALLALLNQGPFVLRPPQDGLRDDYGRELVQLERQRGDGTAEDLAQTLVASGAVRRYDFGPRQSWC